MIETKRHLNHKPLIDTYLFWKESQRRKKYKQVEVDFNQQHTNDRRKITRHGIEEPNLIGKEKKYS